eukprot:9467483-Pyramimonas_sp.AAC.1
MWHSAQAARIPNDNHKLDCDGERLIMVMCCLGRAFHAAALARKYPQWGLFGQRVGGQIGPGLFGPGQRRARLACLPA